MTDRDTLTDRLDALEDAPEDEAPDEYRIYREVVNSGGDVIDTQTVTFGTGGDHDRP